MILSPSRDACKRTSNLHQWASYPLLAYNEHLVLPLSISLIATVSTKHRQDISHYISDFSRLSLTTLCASVSKYLSLQITLTANDNSLANTAQAAFIRSRVLTTTQDKLSFLDTADMLPMQPGDMQSYQTLHHYCQNLRQTVQGLQRRLQEFQRDNETLQRRVLHLQEDNGHLRTQMNNLYMSRGTQVVNGNSFPLGQALQLTPELTPQIAPAAFQQQPMRYIGSQTIDLTGDNEVDVSQQAQTASAPLYGHQGNLADGGSPVFDNNGVGGVTNLLSGNLVQFNAAVMNSNFGSCASGSANGNSLTLRSEISSGGSSKSAGRPVKRRRTEAPEWMPGYSNRALNSTMNNMTGNIAVEETKWALAEAQRMAQQEAIVEAQRKAQLEAIQQSPPLPTSANPAPGSAESGRQSTSRRGRTEGRRAARPRRPRARAATPAVAAASAVPPTPPTPQPIQEETTSGDKDDEWEAMWAEAYEKLDEEEEERNRVEAAGQAAAAAAIAASAATEEAEQQVSSDQTNTSTAEPAATTTSVDLNFFDFNLFAEVPDENEAPAIHDGTADQQETTPAPGDQQPGGVDAQPTINNVDGNLDLNDPSLDISLEISLSNGNLDINPADLDPELQQMYEEIMQGNSQNSQTSCDN
jgi:hypothetical protein